MINIAWFIPVNPVVTISTMCWQRFVKNKKMTAGSEIANDLALAPRYAGLIYTVREIIFKISDHFEALLNIPSHPPLPSPSLTYFSFTINYQIYIHHNIKLKYLNIHHSTPDAIQQRDEIF
jgi:hypothetical protein